MSAAARTIVVGGGVNGLVAALVLARAGREVLVLERRERCGGLSAGEEFAPGFRHGGILHDAGAFPAGLARELGLETFGLALLPAPTRTLALTPGGESLAWASDGTGLRPASAAAWSELSAQLARWRGALGGLLERPPSDPVNGDWRTFLRVARDGLALRRLGERDLTALLRALPMCVGDFLRERFADPLLESALAADAVRFTFAGPWSPGTACNLVLEHTTRSAQVARGGPAAVVDALLAAAAARREIELRPGSEVVRLLVDGGRVRGVELAGGATIEGATILLAGDPRSALLDLVAPRDLPASTAEEIAAVRMRGTSAKLHVALDGELRPRDAASDERVLVVPADLDALERAFDAAKYGRMSPEPLLEIVQPSRSRPDLAPPGRSVLSLLVHFAPLDLAGGWTGTARDELTDRALGVLERAVPGTRERVLAVETLTPADLATRYGARHPLHGEPALDQLFFQRPTLSLSRYATPIAGLFLCGGGSHPAGICGVPGRLGARAALGTRK